VKHWMKLIVLTIASVLLLAACGGETASPTSGTGGSTGGGAQEQTVSVDGEQLKFDKATLTAKAGQPIKFTFNNTSTVLKHSFVIDNPKVSIPADAATGLDPKASGSAEATLPAGTYTYYCAVVGHKESGMVGTLTVQ
jgi:plastocyanin